VIAAAQSKRIVVPPAPGPLDIGARTSSVRLIVIGTSTGGPQALTRLITALPHDLPCAVAVALHIPAGYTEALARRLDESCAVRVFEASDGATIAPGSVAIARGGAHMRLSDNGGVIRTHVGPHPLAAPFRPSVNELFESAAVFGAAVLGVVLTGMGDDGLLGARAIHAAGGRILTEAESSSVVYGMPRVVREAGLSIAEARIENMAETILRHL
jgi:two-component system chemotaxis response regulator CheB